MAAHAASTEPLRDDVAQPEPPAQSAMLQVPGQASDGADERTGRALTQNATCANSPRPPSAIHASTQVCYDDPDFTRPPDLNYSLRPRMRGIAFFWTLIALDCVALPIALYFGLWYGTSLSPNAVFSISTGALGTVSIVEYFIRFHRLWKKGSTCRVIGAQRFYVRRSDAFASSTTNSHSSTGFTGISLSAGSLSWPS